MRTGITPNILARIGFTLSLDEPGTPQDPFDSEESGRETLLGEHDAAYVALLRTWVAETDWLKQNDLPAECSTDQFNDLFVAHMNRGFELLSARMRDLPGLGNLLATVNP